MSRILHFADLHLDTTFSSAGQQPRQALRDCLRRLVDLALQQQADVVTIGGDLYEHERRCSDTGKFVRSELARLGTVPVIVAPGNHDPYTPDSLYRAIEWPGNVRVLSSPDLEPVEVGGDLTVWGAAFTNRFRRDCPLDGFGGANGTGGSNVLLLHAALGDAPSDYSPLSPAAVRRAGFDLALLGHIHDGGYSRADLGVYYPGSPEPLDFSEAGDHYVLLVDIDGGAPVVQRLASNRMRFGSLSVDVGGADSRDAVRDLVLRQAEAAGLGGGTVRVCLTGVLDEAVDLDAVALGGALASAFAFVDVSDETDPPYDWEALRQGYTTKARFVRRLLDASEAAAGPEERRRCQEALVLGMRAFEGRPLLARQRQWRPGVRRDGEVTP